MEKMVSGMGRLTLNPNAAEFIPAALKASTTTVESSSLGSNNKQGNHTRVLNRNDSDDERRQYWKDQLPDDIIPDFSELNDERFSWQHDYTEESGAGLGEVWHLDTGEGAADPLELLVNQFPGFAAQSLADILSANGGDLFLTFEMLTQLEDEVGPARQLQSQTQIHSHTPNINLGDFPALAGSEFPNGVDRERNLQHALRTQRGMGVEDLFTSRPYASGGGFRGSATDFAAAVRKNAEVASAQWERERSTQTERLSQTGEFPAKSVEKVGNVSTRARQSTPLWLETGKAVSNMYTDLREEARDHARVRNAYFEQARQAYLSGNKALAKDLAAKGQVHNGLMKEAHNKAGEAIFQQRNVSIGGFSNGQSQLLDLHGLHVNEAIPLLKRELAALRATARSSRQRLQVLICVGTGHHTKGSRTPARLPVAVEKFLAEDEHLSYTEQQPGMLMVVLS